ncbi:type VI secretion system-associated FHA domain protein TagH [Hydrocarboniclastica marina]|uniref:Type VI secretion system-associated FHA domain protein TagH n=1 Tax=Hydrocarboniclastica marina TaxID=2259620 RepID=A0A4P7XDV3_9ALTE|nr:type VI secretion system-associated FHA domain protein TagH [Hydrocarboniclastica marina]QCF24723.1 type VI secretion system-associated FHA domain protein TagH [Hydrocarboniclastica marina]
MELALAITSYQRLSPTVVTRHVFASSGEHSVGRSQDCDWHLPDPDRVVSSRHAQLCYRDGQFLLTDVSTNGVFLNDEVEPIGTGNARPLADGDRLRFGDYHIAVSLSPAAEHSAAAVPEPVQSSPLPESVNLDANPSGAQLGERAIGVNPTLASGLDDRRVGDSHVDLPSVEIPPVWGWGEEAATQDAMAQASTERVQIEALFQGLGMPELTAQTVPAEVMRGVGELTKLLLEQLLDLLHWRAEQKQKLRVQQTLFQRTENNPLKFSATAQDAVDALVLRRHSSFLGSKEAIEAAFADVRNHDSGLMAGLQAVIADLLHDADGTEHQRYGRTALIAKARAWDALRERRTAQRESLGSTDQILRNDVFIDAYENAGQEQG